MKVYVLIGGWDYEGYSEPIGVYSTKDKAEAHKEDKDVVSSRYDSLDVLEYELDG